MSLTTERRKSSRQVLTRCGNSFRMAHNLASYRNPMVLFSSLVSLVLLKECWKELKGIQQWRLRISALEITGRVASCTKPTFRSTNTHFSIKKSKALASPSFLPTELYPDALKLADFLHKFTYFLSSGWIFFVIEKLKLRNQLEADEKPHCQKCKSWKEFLGKCSFKTNIKTFQTQPALLKLNLEENKSSGRSTKGGE